MAGARHSWDPTSKNRKLCSKCGTEAHRRPDPYSRKWFTEWTRDGKSTNSYDGGKTPPCSPEEPA